jgi:hypothetical protein
VDENSSGEDPGDHAEAQRRTGKCLPVAHRLLAS